VEQGPRQAARRDGSVLLLCGLLFAGAAALFDFLWLAREPRDGGMAFAVRRLGLRLVLSAPRFEAFALTAALAAVACAIAAFVLARRAIGPAGATRGGARPWRRAAALSVLLVCVVPLHRALGWAAGGLELTATLDGAWERVHFFRLLGLESAPRLLWLAAALALGGHLLVTRRRWPSGALAALVSRLERLPRALLVSAAAAAVVGLAAAYSLGVLQGQPHYQDATLYYCQAKAFASGRLWSPLLGGREFFDPLLCPVAGNAVFLFRGDHWAAAGLPGAPLLYAAGFLVGCPWIVAPLLGGGLVVATYLLAKEVFGDSVALLALPLAALSPWLVFMSGEYLTHVPCAVALAAFLAAALRAMGRPSWPAAAIAGLCLGIGAAIRPVTALGFSLPVAVAWIIWLAREPGRAWRATAAFAVALALPLAGLLAYNAAMTGSAATFPYLLAAREGIALRQDYFAGVYRALPRTKWLSNLLEMSFLLDSAAFRWPFPAVGAVLGTLLLLGAGGASGRRSPALITGLCILSLALAYVWWPEVSLVMGGPRYLFEALPLVIVLAAGAASTLSRRLTQAGLEPGRVRGLLALVLLLCFAYAGSRTLTSDLASHRRVSQVDARVFAAVKARAEAPALVFYPVRDRRGDTLMLFAALAQNDPGLDGPVLYARDLGPRNRLLAEARPGRHCYRWDHEKFRLVPIDPGQEARR